MKYNGVKKVVADRSSGWSYDTALWIWICLVVAVLGLTLGMFGCGMPVRQWQTGYPVGYYDPMPYQPLGVTVCNGMGTCVTN